MFRPYWPLFNISSFYCNNIAAGCYPMFRPYWTLLDLMQYLPLELYQTLLDLFQYFQLVLTWFYCNNIATLCFALIGPYWTLFSISSWNWPGSTAIILLPYVCSYWPLLGLIQYFRVELTWFHCNNFQLQLTWFHCNDIATSCFALIGPYSIFPGADLVRLQ
jgi:hypothetical protein